MIPPDDNTPQADPIAEAMGDVTNTAEAQQSTPNPAGEPIPESVDIVDNIMAELTKASVVEETPDEDAPKDPKDTKAKGKAADAEVELDEEGIAVKPPGNSTPDAIAKWGELRTELKQERARAQQLAQELEKAKKQGVPDPELLEKAKYADEAEKQLAIAKVEATREFKQVIDAPLEAIGAAAEAIAKRHELSSEDLFDALAEPDVSKRNAMFEELLSGIPDADRFSIYQMALDTQAIFDKRDELHEKAIEARKEIDAKLAAEAEREKEQFKKTLSESITKTTENLKKVIPFIDLEDGTTVDSYFDELVDKAMSSDFNASAPSVQAFSVVSALMVPRLTKQIAVLKERAAKAESRVAELTQGGPGTRAPQRTTTPDIQQSDDWVENIARAISR